MRERRHVQGNRLEKMEFAEGLRNLNVPAISKIEVCKANQYIHRSVLVSANITLFSEEYDYLNKLFSSEMIKPF